MFDESLANNEDSPTEVKPDRKAKTSKSKPAHRTKHQESKSDVFILIDKSDPDNTSSKVLSEEEVEEAAAQVAASNLSGKADMELYKATRLDPKVTY